MDPTSGVKYIYNNAIGAWESAIQPPSVVSATEPSITIEGFLWWDTTNSRLKVYNAGNWDEVAPNTGTQVSVSNTPPGGAGNGSLWYDSEEGRMYVYYIDVDSSQWVVASPLEAATSGAASIGSSSPAAADSSAGDLWLNTNNSQLYVYNSTSWVATANEVSGVSSVTGGTNVSVSGTALDPVVNVPDATTAALGAIRIADQATVDSASSTTDSITPGTLAAGISNYLPDATETIKGVMEIAT